MYSKYLEETARHGASLRFKHRAIVTCYYTSTNLDYSPRIMLEDVDVFFNGSIGIREAELSEQVYEAFPNLSEEYKKEIMTNFKINSFSVNEGYISIEPEFILQCTGKNSSNSTYIFEGDIIQNSKHVSYAVIWDSEKCGFYLQNIKEPTEIITFSNNEKYKVIGNIYQDLGEVE